MKKLSWGIIIFVVLSLFGIGYSFSNAHAEEESDTNTEESAGGGTSISLTPVNKVLQIASNSVYEDKMTINNDGDSDMKIEVYAAPYFYIYSESEDTYKLGFSTENNYTQIARWITFKDTDGNWSKKANYTIEPKKSLDVTYQISTPNNISGGGQYAVIFAHTLTSTTSGGIRTEASPGMVVYGRSTEGETIVKPVISDLKIEYGVNDGTTTRNDFYASAKVKNDGNVDFNVIGEMTIKDLFGGEVYKTLEPRGRISVIPEAELVVSDEWEESPFFGIYHVSWTVRVGDESETIEKTIFVNFALFLLITIILLTIIAIWIIMRVRKRKERRSRLAV